MSDAPLGRVSLRELFLGFSEIGLTGFGGVLPWAHRMIVERRRWLSGEEFAALLGLCQFMPGPNVMNLAVVIGERFQGRFGAIVAPLGIMAGPFCIVVALGALYGRFGALPAVQAMLHGVSAVGAGLILAAGIRMALALRRRLVIGLLTLATFVTVALLRIPLLLVMFSLCPLGVWWSLRRLGGLKA